MRLVSQISHNESQKTDEYGHLKENSDANVFPNFKTRRIWEENDAKGGPVSTDLKATDLMSDAADKEVLSKGHEFSVGVLFDQTRKHQQREAAGKIHAT